MDKPIYVIGHKNPDTDSICSAICYAALKSRATGHAYVAKRAGHLNDETRFVLERAGVTPPEYIKDVRPQVKDIELTRPDEVSEDISVKSAWNIMKDMNVVTLPVAEDGKLTGLITIGDIARSYFEVYDSNILSLARTKFQNVVDTLSAQVITGDTERIIETGKVVIAAANPEMMEQYIEPGDIVILGNRYEAQLCAIEMNASCLVICEGAQVSMTITKFAKEHDCIIMTTAYDTYTVARLINQSMPISYYMRREGLITFHENDFIEDIQDIMAQKRHRDFPIVDDNGCYVGMISRRRLLKPGRKKLILVDHNEKSQAVSGVETADILEIIDHHRIGSIQTVTPVFFRNQPLGCTATIIYQMYNEYGVEIDKTIAALLCSAIISDTLIFRSPTCTQADIDAGMHLAEIAGIDVDSYGREMFKAGSNLSSKTPKELFFRDFKKFAVNDIVVGVGQLNCMTEEEMSVIREPMREYIKTVAGENGIQMAFFMLTDIMAESSEVLCAGKNAAQLLANAFNVDAGEDSVMLKGVVSRKKQLLPAVMEALQQ